MKQVYRCVIIDDEKVDRKILKSHLKKIPNLELVNSFDSPINALTVLNEASIDILFLDVEMPEMTGIEFLKALKIIPQTILISAHAEYSLGAFEVGVTDYLQKPYGFERFLKAVNRAMEMVQLRARYDVKSTVSEEFIFLKSGRELLKFNVDEILYVEALASFSKVYTSSEKYTLISESISELQNKFPSNYFLRIHKSYLVAKNKIVGISTKQIILENIKIPMGLSYREEVEKVLSFK
ncbi:MAG: LytTR family DNA-binding domain-containing protein [Arcicella sp.]|nr:LytTR family DNA-binding domain-containing protein [Arcicella sp.]